MKCGGRTLSLAVMVKGRVDREGRARARLVGPLIIHAKSSEVPVVAVCVLVVRERCV